MVAQIVLHRPRPFNAATGVFSQWGGAPLSVMHATPSAPTPCSVATKCISVSKKAVHYKSILSSKRPKSAFKTCTLQRRACRKVNFHVDQNGNMITQTFLISCRPSEEQVTPDEALSCGSSLPVSRRADVEMDDLFWSAWQLRNIQKQALILAARYARDHPQYTIWLHNKFRSLSSSTSATEQQGQHSSLPRGITEMSQGEILEEMKGFQALAQSENRGLEGMASKSFRRTQKAAIGAVLAMHKLLKSQYRSTFTQDQMDQYLRLCSLEESRPSRHFAIKLAQADAFEVRRDSF